MLTVTEHQQLLPLARGDLAQQRQQVVRYALGVLAHDAARVGTAGVEVTEVGAVPLLEGLAGLLRVLALGGDPVINDLLDDSLRPAVGVRGADRAVLGDGDHVLKTGGIAVDGGGGREDDVGDIVSAHGVQEGNRAADIDAVVFQGNLG